LFSISEIIDMAVQLEKNGEQIYLSAIDQTNDPGLKQLLKWMADEERQHAKWFLGLNNALIEDEDDGILKDMSDALISDFINGQTFSLKEIDFSTITHPNELIKTFIEFEKDTILFYTILIPFIKNDHTVKELNRIIAEEETHIQKLTELIIESKEFNE